ncbi:MAG: 50S ribosomal protein L25 [Actinomycetes bacterium]
MANDTPVLEAQPRDLLGSRNTRRLRREGVVPGVVYGGDSEPVSLQVPERELRVALGAQSALIELKLGSETQPVLVREHQRHPVTGRYTHVDLIRVRLDVKVEAQVPIELVGTEMAPGVRLGGLLEQTLREITVEALPMEIPESVSADVSAMEIGDNLSVSAIVSPDNVNILDDQETVIATLSASRMAMQLEREGEEGETEVVGEAAAEAEGGEAKAEAPAEGGGDGGEE